jgi:hypothetical protein
MPYGDLLADVVQGSTANTPPVFKDGNGTTIGTLCRAWVNFNGTGTVAIRASFNVSSITDNGLANYTVNFTNTMPDGNYAVITGQVSSVVGGIDARANSLTVVRPSGDVYSTSSVTVAGYNEVSGASTADLPIVNIAIFR